VPANQVEGEMAADSLKIGFVASDHGGADAAGGKGDEHIKSQLAKLVKVVTLALPYGVQEVGCLYPVRLGRRQDLASVHEVNHEAALESRPGATKQLMQNDSRAANDKSRGEDMRREARGSKVLNIDRGVKNGKSSCA